MPKTSYADLLRDAIREVSAELKALSDSEFKKELARHLDGDIARAIDYCDALGAPGLENESLALPLENDRAIESLAAFGFQDLRSFLVSAGSYEVSCSIGYVDTPLAWSANQVTVEMNSSAANVDTAVTQTSVETKIQNKDQLFYSNGDESECLKAA